LAVRGPLPPPPLEFTQALPLQTRTGLDRLLAPALGIPHELVTGSPGCPPLSPGRSPSNWFASPCLTPQEKVLPAGLRSGIRAAPGPRRAIQSGSSAGTRGTGHRETPGIWWHAPSPVDRRGGKKKSSPLRPNRSFVLPFLRRKTAYAPLGQGGR
jgi:hypothetical protein